MKNKEVYEQVRSKSESEIREESVELVKSGVVIHTILYSQHLE